MIGVDENGLGPVLGPLVVTGVGISLGRYSVERHAALGRELGIDDSKLTSAFGKMAVAEGLALAAFEALFGGAPECIDSLFGKLLRRAPSVLQGGCPDGTRPQCWSAPLRLPCFGGDVHAGRAILAGLRAARITLSFARSEILCASDLNQRLALGQSRVEADLEAMEQLVCDARSVSGEDLTAVCGMVGGIRNYPDRFRHFPRARVRARKSTPLALPYDVPEIGRVSFEIDADQRHLPVAFASMIGKYVRELWMARQNAFYRTHLPGMEDVSGYHDPVTRRFIADSGALRVRLGIAGDCFTRRNAKEQRERAQLRLFEQALDA